MNKLILIILLCLPLLGMTQNPAGFDEMCQGYVEGTVPLITSSKLNAEMIEKETLVILDAREEKEYRVSHIKGAINVGYDRLNLRAVKRLPKDTKIVVYCSIGYRSEKVGEKLKKAGYSSVFNLKGGLFDWANNGFDIVDMNEKPINKLHGFDKEWGKWVNPTRNKLVVE